jgi:hypothetical protein
MGPLGKWVRRYFFSGLTTAANERESGKSEKAQRAWLRNGRVTDSVVLDVLNGSLIEGFVPNTDVIDVAAEVEGLTTVGTRPNV